MSETPTYFGIEIGATKLQVLAVSGEGRVLRRCRTGVHLETGAAGIREAITEEVSRLRAGLEPVAVGVGFGGPVDWRTGVVVQSHQVDGWSGFPLAEWLSDELGGIPVVVENDAKAAAFAEAQHGAGRGFSPVFYSNSGSGVGAGLVVDGELYRGMPPGELELGHVRLSADGRTVEDGASGWSLDRRVREHAHRQPSGCLAGLLNRDGGVATEGGEARVLSEALAAGDREAELIVSETARDYAYGLSHAVHLLHPGIIVLGGGVSLLGERWRAAVARHLPEFLMEAFRPGPPIAIAELGEAVVPIGAAMLARRRLRVRGPRSSAGGGTIASWLRHYIDAQHRAIDSLQPGAIVPVLELLAEANVAGRRIFACGNGGNAANASHFVTDLAKNASDASARRFRVLSVNDNASWMTAIGNDLAYDQVFVRQLANHAEAGDLLIVSSVSGDSPNIVRALEWAREHRLRTVALVGARRGRAAALAEHVIVIDDTHYGRVEDAQMQVLHMLCYAFVEKAVVA